MNGPHLFCDLHASRSFFVLKSVVLDGWMDGWVGGWMNGLGGLWSRVEDCLQQIIILLC